MFKLNQYLKQIKNPYFREFYTSVRFMLFIPARIGIAGGYLVPPIKRAVGWLFTSRETVNFSYNLSDINNLYLAHTVAVVSGQTLSKIRSYIKEIESNEKLKRHIAIGLKSNPDRFRLGPLVAYARRVGWYAFVRAIKPQIVVETGVEQGLGSVIIAEALRKNEKDGFKGKYFGTDIMPEAGYFFTGDYKKYGEILYGDSVKSLRKFHHKIDLFINDSNHHYWYEKKEYGTIQRLLKNDSVILGDNSHESAALSEFAEKTNRNFIFFKEQPKDHWYTGAGIGIAYSKRHK